MTFKFNPAPTFKWTAEITRPDQAQPVPLELVFRHKTKAEVDDWIERSHAALDAQAEAALIAELIADWGVTDDEGTAVPCTQETLVAFLGNFQTFSFEATTAYLRAVRESRAKN